MLLFHVPTLTAYPSTCATFSKVSTVQFPFPVAKFEIVGTAPPVSSAKRP
jgi:hypothetical protein